MLMFQIHLDKYSEFHGHSMRKFDSYISWFKVCCSCLNQILGLLEVLTVQSTPLHGTVYSNAAAKMAWMQFLVARGECCACPAHGCTSEAGSLQKDKNPMKKGLWKSRSNRSLWRTPKTTDLELIVCCVTVKLTPQDKMPSQFGNYKFLLWHVGRARLAS